MATNINSSDPIYINDLTPGQILWRAEQSERLTQYKVKRILKRYVILAPLNTDRDVEVQIKILKGRTPEFQDRLDTIEWGTSNEVWRAQRYRLYTGDDPALVPLRAANGVRIQEEQLTKEIHALRELSAQDKLARVPGLRALVDQYERCLRNLEKSILETS